MTTLRDYVDVTAERELCFDLVRSVDAHRLAVPGIRARAEDGRTTGLSGYGDSTLWSAVYFGIRWRLWAEVQLYEWPSMFTDGGSSWLLEKFRHRYVLAEMPGGITRIQDQFTFALRQFPGMALFERYLLQPELAKALRVRLQSIKTMAETNLWREILEIQPLVRNSR